MIKITNFNNKHEHHFYENLLFLFIQLQMLCCMAFIYCYNLKMSAITANNSLLDYQARTKSHSRHMRNYQKISEANLDDASIITYLKSRHFTKTLTTFLMQSNSKKSIEPIIDVFLKGGKNYEGSIKQYWQTIKDAILKNHENSTGDKIEDKRTKLVNLEFYIYIWYCIAENQLNVSRLGTLKQFIQSKGETLSQIPELLPYFVLPYVDKKIGNPIVKRIFSEEWKSEVRGLLEQLIGAQPISMEQEWLNIIVDMIEICEELIKNINIESSTYNIKDMVQRVSLYKTVVQKNRNEMKAETQKQNLKLPENKQNFTYNIDNTKQLKEYISRLNESRTIQSTSSIMNAYNKIQKQILHKSQLGIDKTYVSQLIENDILFLKDKGNQFINQYQWLKLLKIMSNYYKCREYLVTFKHIIKRIMQFTEVVYNHKNFNFRMEVLIVCFGFFQKIIVREQLFEQINQYDKVYQICIAMIKDHQFDFQKSKQLSNIFETMLGCIFGAVMHRKGRTKISKTTLFQILVCILKRLPNMESIVGIQLLICSTIYLLLVEKHIRNMAVRLNLKNILLDRMNNKKGGSYETYVQYIIQRIERNDEEQEVDSDQDTQKDEEFDHNIVIHDEVIILSKKNEKNSVQPSKHQANRPVLPQNHSMALNFQDDYAKDRYSWKKKWLKQ